MAHLRHRTSRRRWSYARVRAAVLVAVRQVVMVAVGDSWQEVAEVRRVSEVRAVGGDTFLIWGIWRLLKREFQTQNKCQHTPPNIVRWLRHFRVSSGENCLGNSRWFGRATTAAAWNTHLITACLARCHRARWDLADATVGVHAAEFGKFTHVGLWHGFRASHGRDAWATRWENNEFSV